MSIVSECTYRHYLHSVKLKKTCVSLLTYSAEPFGELGQVYVHASFIQRGTAGLTAHSG